MNSSLSQISFILIVCCSSSVFAHPFHSSSTEMEWNAESHSFEVALKLDPNDLERELRRISGEKIVLEKLPQHGVIFKYIQQVLIVQIGAKQLKLKPVGLELTAQAAWIFAEFPVPEKTTISEIQQLSIINKLLLSQPHQANTLLLKYDQQRLSMLFHEQQTELLLIMDKQTKKFVLNQKQSIQAEND